MWLKIDYTQHELEYEIFKPDTIRISFSDSVVAPLNSSDKSVRLSQIFPLEKNAELNVKEDYGINFFDFENPYRVLGLVKQKGSQELRNSIYFSNGLCSILQVTDESTLCNELMSIVSTPQSYESWVIANSFIRKVNVKLAEYKQLTVPKILDYNGLSNVEISILDEFAISLKILESKIAVHDIESSFKLKFLVNTVNNFIEELIYLTTKIGEVPATLVEKDIKILEDPLEVQILKQQIVDRLIQINTSISYVTTQSFSGSIPILERRSLIRRNSLLGIGMSMKSLNRIVDYIEESFSAINFKEIIINSMPKASPLGGLDNLPVHDSSSWYKQNIETFNSAQAQDPQCKLAYFSARLGFRETEYSITAALNSLASGLSLEWSLMTLTHEMLHSHVRIVLNSIFYGVNNVSIDENFKHYYEDYVAFITKRKPDINSLIDSIRYVIFTYCCNTKFCGSLTVEKQYKAVSTPEGMPFRLLKEPEFWDFFRNEYRNLNEIFVHVLDLHYFYGGRISKYIPLIWCSWSAVPHINADIRQYILRSLLAIASKIDNNPYQRFKLSIQNLKDILKLDFNDKQKFPILSKMMQILEDEDLLIENYFQAFKNSLLIVDLVMQVFFSKTIKSKLLEDDNISFSSSIDGTEDDLLYDAPLEFLNIQIKCPIPYLFDRMTKVLNKEYDISDLERETALIYLGMNSKQ